MDVLTGGLQHLVEERVAVPSVKQNLRAATRMAQRELTTVGAGSKLSRAQTSETPTRNCRVVTSA